MSVEAEIDAIVYYYVLSSLAVDVPEGTEVYSNSLVFYSSCISYLDHAKRLRCLAPFVNNGVHDPAWWWVQASNL
jgi:hypothetical protein